ncbi:MAG: 50S ribosomal protein L25/general stress protein Ctc [Halioglobus sp.]|nr:50S ribosomal protein L25/general stress protein Ctc [Halioglobus sp.]
MSDAFELNAEVREDKGKGASRRLRRLADQVPAIIYGAGKDPQPLTLVRKDLEKALENEGFFSQILTIKVGGSDEKAILKDLQRHPAKNREMHADFMRIDDKVAIKVHVPIHFLNEETCVGVKMEGGIIQHQVTDIEIQCLPADIPAYLEVDMQEISTGQIVHLSDVALPEGVTSVALALGEDHDLAIASVIAPRGGAEEEEPAAEVAEEEGDEAAAEGGDEGGDSEE